MCILRGIGVLALLVSMLGCTAREQGLEAVLERGEAAIDRKEWDKAIAAFTEAIRIDPMADGATTIAVTLTPRSASMPRPSRISTRPSGSNRTIRWATRLWPGRWRRVPTPP